MRVVNHKCDDELSAALASTPQVQYCTLRNFLVLNFRHLAKRRKKIYNVHTRTHMCVHKLLTVEKFLRNCSNWRKIF